MALTLADLLDTRSLALRLVGSAPAAPDSEVQWAAVTELEDPLPFLGGGEVVLTTGLRQLSAAAQRSFVTRVHQARAVAVGYATGLSHAQVPAAAIAQADELGLPIFEVPYSTPFVAISRMIADAIAAGHLARLELLLRGHQRLAGALLAGGGLPALLTELAGLLGTDVVLWQYGTRLAGTTGPADHPRGWDRVPIATGLKDRCTLSIAEPYEHDGIVDYAQSLISVELNNQAQRRASGRAAAGQVLQDIVRATLTGQDALLRLEALGIEPAGAYSVLLVEVASGQVRALKTLPLPAKFDGAVTGVLDGRLVIAAPKAADGALGTALSEYLYGAGLTARVGVGGTYTHPSGLRWSYFEAKGALRHGARLNQPERLSLTSLLLAAEDVPLADLAAEALDPLAAFDAAHGAELLPTLASYLELNGSVGAVAEALKLHRNTVRYRLAQIVELSGYDPAVTADRVHLWLALSIRTTGRPRE